MNTEQHQTIVHGVTLEYRHETRCMNYVSGLPPHPRRPSPLCWHKGGKNHLIKLAIWKSAHNQFAEFEGWPERVDIRMTCGNDQCCNPNHIEVRILKRLEPVDTAIVLMPRRTPRKKLLESWLEDGGASA